MGQICVAANRITVEYCLVVYMSSCIPFFFIWRFLKSSNHAWKQFSPSSDSIFRVSVWDLGCSGQFSAFWGLQIDTNPNLDKHKISQPDNQWFHLTWSKERTKVDACSLISSHRKKDKGDPGSSPHWCIECLLRMYCMLVLVFFKQGLTLYL